MRTLQQVLASVAQADVFGGIDVNSVHTERASGETALHLCAQWGDAEAVRLLLENGADLGKPGEDGNTPLHYAAMFGHLAVVRELVAAKTPNSRDRYGNLPIDLVGSHPELQAYLRGSGYAV